MSAYTTRMRLNSHFDEHTTQPSPHLANAGVALPEAGNKDHIGDVAIGTTEPNCGRVRDEGVVPGIDTAFEALCCQATQLSIVFSTNHTEEEAHVGKHDHL